MQLVLVRLACVGLVAPVPRHCAVRCCSGDMVKPPRPTAPKPISSKGVAKPRPQAAPPPTTTGLWLVKSEPDDYSIDQLAREGTTIWDGVRNAREAAEAKHDEAHAPRASACAAG